jgi:hypothetical protein
MEEPLRYIFISRGTPTYENVYRPQEVDSGERKSITARLLSGKFLCKDLLYFLYMTMFFGTPGFLGTLVGKHCCRHFVLNLSMSCCQLGKVIGLGGCYGNSRVEPLVSCEGVPYGVVSEQANGMH